MFTLHIILYAALVTAVASAAHGGEYGRKGWVVALHTLALPTAPLFWIFLRRGKHAKAELDLIAGHGTLQAVRDAYPAPLGWVMMKAMAWCQKHHWAYVEDGRPNYRTQQELVGGFICGVPLGILVATIFTCASKFL